MSLKHHSPVGLLLLVLIASGNRCFSQPTNDTCAGAISLAPDVVFAMNTSTATSAGDPTNVCSGPFGNGVWFTFSPPRSGRLTVSTCGSDFDAVLQVFTGTCDALNPMICADDYGPACPARQASVTFSVSAGFVYYIAAGGYAGASGNLNIVASMALPPNDQCDGAIALTAGVTFSQNTDNATSTNDPAPPCAPNGGQYGAELRRRSVGNAS